MVCDIVAARLTEPDCSGGSLLDGFPRTVPQAEMLNAWLLDNGRSVGAVISIEVASAKLVTRLSGRRTCLACGATYHIENNPPTRPGQCDQCESDVVQRKDDSVETIRSRLDTYAKDTAPVLSWLKSRTLVHEVDGDQPIEKVRGEILAAIQV